MQLAPLLDSPYYSSLPEPLIGSAIAKSSKALEDLPPIPEEHSTKQKPELLSGSYMQGRMRGVGIFLYIHQHGLVTRFARFHGVYYSCRSVGYLRLTSAPNSFA